MTDSPAPICDDALKKEIMERVVTPTMKGMAAEGRTFRGVLYCGMMVDKNSGTSKVLECTQFGLLLSRKWTYMLVCLALYLTIWLGFLLCLTFSTSLLFEKQLTSASETLSAKYSASA